MTRQEWAEIAAALARARAQAESPDCVERAARAVCRVLHKHSHRFDGRKFMRIVLG